MIVAAWQAAQKRQPATSLAVVLTKGTAVERPVTDTGAAKALVAAAYLSSFDMHSVDDWTRNRAAIAKDTGTYPPALVKLVDGKLGIRMESAASNWCTWHCCTHLIVMVVS